MVLISPQSGAHNSPTSPRDMLKQVTKDEKFWTILLNRAEYRSDKYDSFNYSNISSSSLLSVAGLTTLCLIPLWVIGGYQLLLYTDSFDRTLNWIVSLAFLLLVDGGLWFAWYHRTYWTSRCCSTDIPESERRRFIHALKASFLAYVALTSYRLIDRATGGHCQDERVVWGCHLSGEHLSLPADSLFLCMIMPLVFTFITRGAYPLFGLGLFALAVSACVFSIAWLAAYQSISLVAFYFLFGLVLISEAKRQNCTIFLLYRNLEAYVEQREKAVDNDLSTEMRHMIANVAHDLKTVSRQAFVLLYCLRVVF